MKKILVIGESCTDVFVYCDARRLAPDLPIPVLGIIDETENPGMAMNLERNIKSIYPNVTIVTNPGWRQVTKTRFMHRASNHAFLRVDTITPIPRVNIKKVPLDSYDIIVISDYNKGFLLPEDIAYICDHHPLVFIDTKKVLGDWATKAKYIKINDAEYRASEPALTPELKGKIIRTRGEQGAEFKGKVYPVKKVEVKDLTGAGDTFFAGLIVKYAQTGDIVKSIRFANACASEVVKHRGVSVIGQKK